MGVGVSGWQLAREVALLGQLGVVSGTALDTILIRRLGSGDPGGHMRRALAAFPDPQVSSRVLDRYLRGDPVGVADSLGAIDAMPRGHGASSPRYPLLPLPRAKLTPDREWLLILANFAEVYLAKEGHHGVVGINFLHKIQFPILPSLYGAMLAGVDVVLMGAGIPGDIPAVLDRLARHEPASITLDVLGAGDQRYETSFDPGRLWETEGPRGTGCASAEVSRHRIVGDAGPCGWSRRLRAASMASSSKRYRRRAQRSRRGGAAAFAGR
jgi:NAD(P)H-dependent flavin oxidoreductase YrpB (nitropropane dioxygenase family)